MLHLLPFPIHIIPLPCSALVCVILLLVSSAISRKALLACSPRSSRQAAPKHTGRCTGKGRSPGAVNGREALDRSGKRAV